MDATDPLAPSKLIVLVPAVCPGGTVAESGPKLPAAFAVGEAMAVPSNEIKTRSPARNPDPLIEIWLPGAPEEGDTVTVAAPDTTD